MPPLGYDSGAAGESVGGQAYATQGPRLTDIAENTTELLNRLLRNYDRRLRPGFGGQYTEDKRRFRERVGNLF